MPIRPLEGMPLHTRALSIAVSRESDALWYARGDIIDLRKNGFVPSSYDIQPSGIIHSMNIELHFDPVSLRIERIAVDQPFIAIDPSEATEGECCRDPAPRLLDFEGDSLDADFTKRLSAHFGGALGCSHLLTLFQLMASTIPRAVEIENERHTREGTECRLGEKFFRRSVFIDGHLRDDNRIDVAVQLADTHSRPLPPAEPFTKRLESSHEWKILATIERNTRAKPLASRRIVSLSGPPTILVVLVSPTRGAAHPNSVSMSSTSTGSSFPSEGWSGCSVVYVSSRVLTGKTSTPASSGMRRTCAEESSAAVPSTPNRAKPHSQARVARVAVRSALALLGRSWERDWGGQCILENTRRCEEMRFFKRVRKGVAHTHLKTE